MGICHALLQVMVDLQATFDLPIVLTYPLTPDPLVPVFLEWKGDEPDEHIDWFIETAEAIYHLQNDIRP